MSERAGVKSAIEPRDDPAPDNRRGRWGLLAALGVAAVVAAAAGLFIYFDGQRAPSHEPFPQGDAPVSPSPSPAAEVIAGGEWLAFPVEDPGVLERYELLRRPVSRDMSESPDGAVLELVSCRVRWPGQIAFDVEWQPPDQDQTPVELIVDVGYIAGSTMGVPFRLWLTGPGRFTLPMDLREVEQATGHRLSPLRMPDSAAGLRRPRFGEGTSCFMEVLVAPIPVTEWVTGVEPVADPLRLATTAPAGTLQRLAQEVDPASPRDPALPAAVLLGSRPGLPVDRIYAVIDSRWWWRSVDLSDDDGCVRATSEYSSQARPDGTIIVVQRGGCPDPDYLHLPHTNRASLSDPPWQLDIFGHDVDGEELELFIQGLTALTNQQAP